MEENKKLILIAGIFGFTGVALGAFGAHQISDKISSELYETYKTGVLYHLIHSLIIAIIGFSSIKKFNLAAYFFSAGFLLFSFYLYFYSLTSVIFLAMISYFGGVFFLFVYVFFFW